MQCLLLATPQHMRPFNPIAQTLTYNIHVAASNFRRIPCHTSISDSTSPLAMPAPLTLQLARAPQTAPQHQEQLQDLHTRMLYVHTHTHTNTHIHTHLHISVSFKGDASLFRHFVSLFRGYTATHQCVAGYPVSRKRDIKNPGEDPVSLCSFGWSLRDQGSSPSKLALLPFCYRPSIKHSRTCDLGAKNQIYTMQSPFSSV
jgi:hypothetical protein